MKICRKCGHKQSKFNAFLCRGYGKGSGKVCFCKCVFVKPNIKRELKN